MIRYNKKILKNELDDIIEKMYVNAKKFGEAYPAPATINNNYEIIENREWTNSFWTGMLWLSYEFTNDDRFKKLAEINCESFIHRLESNYELDHHDIGFLYTLSLVAGYKVTGSERYREYALLAAKKLANRFDEKGGFIKAWSDSTSSNENRCIIDSLLNVPLLMWAFNETKDENLRLIIKTHCNTVLTNIIREDSTTYHTFFFDKETGKPLYGKTRQGFNDNSCWSRGQSWAIYGQALIKSYGYDKEISLAKFHSVTDYFVNHCPKNSIPYWDFYFNDANPSDLDTSAHAIALCGLDEWLKFEPLNDEWETFFTNSLEKLINERNRNLDESGLLSNGVYSWHTNRGVGEANIWGDYYYFELIYRLYNRRWEKYW